MTKASSLLACALVAGSLSTAAYAQCGVNQSIPDWFEFVVQNNNQTVLWESATLSIYNPNNSAADTYDVVVETMAKGQTDCAGSGQCSMSSLGGNRTIVNCTDVCAGTIDPNTHARVDITLNAGVDFQIRVRYAPASQHRIGVVQLSLHGVKSAPGGGSEPVSETHILRRRACY